MIFYGGVGWLIGRWTGIAALFPVGLLLGLGLALALVIFRYARP
jgi:ATP synthase protein I